MEKLLIKNRQAPGDYVVLSAAIRDLHRCYPGKYQTAIELAQPAVFQHNPYNAPLISREKVRTVNATYSEGPWRIQLSNQQPRHFMWGFIGDLNKVLGVNITLTDFKPDLYLTDEEKAEPLYPKPYWLFGSGGKNDFTAKWWHPDYWKVVVDSIKTWCSVLQVGSTHHVHPAIPGAIDMVGKTSFRELMRLIYHAEGVMCIVTCFMHIAAAFNKPCVVIAGGREHWWWEAYTRENREINMKHSYPDWKPPSNDNFIPHQFLHTFGQLDCCLNTGCWKSHVIGKVHKDRMCKRIVDVNGKPLPKCLDLVTPDHVLHGVEWYYENGILSRKKEIKVILPPLPAPALIKMPTTLGNVKEIKEVKDVRPVTGKVTVNCFIPDGLNDPLGYLELLRKTALKTEVDMHIFGYKDPEQLREYCDLQGWKYSVTKTDSIQTMKQACEDSCSDSFTWIQYPAVPRGGWVSSLDLNKAYGIVYWSNINKDNADRLKLAIPGCNIEENKINPTVYKVHSFDSSFISVPGRQAKALLLNSKDNDFMVVLCEGFKRFGITIEDAGSILTEL